MDNTDPCRNCRAEQNAAERQNLQHGVEPRAELDEVDETTTKCSMFETREKLRIASKHIDTIGQFILLAKIKLNDLPDDTMPYGYSLLLERVRDLLDQAINKVRVLQSLFIHPLLAEAGLESALKYLCRQIESENGLQVNFADDGTEKPLGEEPRSIVYHAARESLLNVVEHAKDSTVQLTISRVGNMLLIVVEDRRSGYDAPDTVSYHRKTGRFNFCQCIRQLGGDITLESAPGGKTRISIRVPLSIALPA